MAKKNNQYLNWNDIFKINLIDKEGKNCNVDQFVFECWDYNIDNIERNTDHIATVTLNLKTIKFDISNNSSF